jgi:ATP-dependent helicase/nuclease subunit A
MSKLSIVRASAGSGKTYRLTLEYLRLLFRYPDNYRNILAVTFTNKATAEMKGRILKELDLLSKGEKSGMANELEKLTGLTQIQLQLKADETLQKILHDYGLFSVGTIDWFIQKIIRAFARETGLQSGLNIETDIKRVLSESIEQLLFEIEKHPELYQWLISFACGKAEEGKNWDIRSDMQKLGNEIFRESYKNIQAELNQLLDDKDFLKKYLAQTHAITGAFEKHMYEIGTKALLIIENHSLLVEDFSYGKTGVANYFNRMVTGDDYEPKSRVLNALENPDAWYQAKSKRKDEIIAACNAGLTGLLAEAVELYNAQSTNYYTAKTIQQNIYTLGALHEIAQQVSNYCTEKNIFLLADASRFLHEIIDNNDTPFIYEKAGSAYHYLMIDEFQDTSGFQWDSFRPLILNSLSEGYDSLVVGDVKQSIYRWRNGDWKILATQIEKEFQHHSVQPENLQYNWRSEANVIRFNNQFFSFAANLLQQQINNELDSNEQQLLLAELGETIINAYNAHEQKVPEKLKPNEGYIKIHFVEKTEDENADEIILKNIPAQIEQLQDNGFRAGDIAIIVRTRQEGKQVANVLLNCKARENNTYNYNVVSDEAMYIVNSSAVQLILASMRFLTDPGDDINRYFLHHELQTYILETKNKTVLSVSEETESKLQAIRHVGLFETSEAIIELFGLNNLAQDTPYLQAFQDVIIEYSAKEPPDVHSFLAWWDETASKHTIALSEQQDAVRILTIHKAKGLQFGAVLIPFCQWPLGGSSRNDNYLWCRITEAPFDQLPLVPVKYGDALTKTHFSRDYYIEKLQACIDNLNLLYVAFTRPCKALLMSAAKPSEKKKESFSKVSEIVFAFCKRAESNNLITGTSDENCFECGKIPVNTPAKQDPTTPYALSQIPSTPIGSRIRIKFSSNEFTQNNDVQSESIMRGKLMHRIFEAIKTPNDIAPAVNQLLSEGLINIDDCNLLQQKVTDAISQAKVSHWFNPEWTVKTEADILLPTGKINRPDRVMIRGKEAIVVDYKFGTTTREKYGEQVKNYANTLRSMGFDKVQGYIWYVEENNVVEVV